MKPCFYSPCQNFIHPPRGLNGPLLEARLYSTETPNMNLKMDKTNTRSLYVLMQFHFWLYSKITLFILSGGGVVTKVLDCDILVSGLDFQSLYYIQVHLPHASLIIYPFRRYEIKKKHSSYLVVWINFLKSHSPFHPQKFFKEADFTDILF